MITKQDKSCGVIPLSTRVDGYYVLIVQMMKGHWGFPKGHGEKGETEGETARRELQEETGIKHIRVLEDPAFVETYAFDKKEVHREKTVKYFLGFTESDATTPCEGEIQNLQWVKLEEVEGILTYESTREIARKVKAYLGV